MSYWTETNEITNTIDVKTKINNATVNIGLIERPYNTNDVFIVSIDNQFLFNGDSYSFPNIEAAFNSLIKAYERSITE